MKIKGIVFILFIICVGYVGAMEPDKGTVQGQFQPPTLKKAVIKAKAKQIYDKKISLEGFKKELEKVPKELEGWSLAELGREYYILYGEKLDTSVPWGLSIEDYLSSPVLKEKIKIITDRGEVVLNLEGMKINSLQGLQNIPNILTVQTLDLENNQLTTIESNTFAGLTNLKYLHLSGNNLTTIESNTFAGLTSLEVLVLKDNQLTMIESNAFAGLTSLEGLYLQNNQLTTIESNAFAGLTSLKYLDLENNQLTMIESNAFADLTNLKYFDLKDNNLTTIESKTFAGLTSLKSLVLRGNKQLSEPTKDAIRKALPGVKIDF